MADYDTEEEFLKHYNVRQYDLPLATVDMAIFTVQDQQLQVLLVKRALHPAKGQWALPGGFIDMKKDQSLSDTAYRKLKEKTGVDTPYLEQVATFGNASRDPRGWSLTVSYFALISSDQTTLSMDSRSEEVAWVPVTQVGELELAFDHEQILQACHERLRAKVQYTSVPVNLMPEVFTLVELQKTFEIILGSPIEKKSFRRRIADADILEETGEMKSGPSRPAKLYRVKNKGENYFFTRLMEGAR
ncbi:NUDIX hydrolase [Hahella sp. CCB-MM4]|uniref:NUDIX hydrolase n=1 Tax=Hahella sp. (strain CCB-MM4) TaxID=1926491 RepID=UPI000B9B0783|nr:NUDIX domain-containing protein [Hahella sp. CCB-MM4]OZG74180.1 NUDIX hydrolase [Hahella sp. CCB-MM4]